MTLTVRFACAAALLVTLGACASKSSEDWTTDQQAAYDQCLRDNQAVATAWEEIERRCREQVEGLEGGRLKPGINFGIGVGISVGG